MWNKDLQKSVMNFGSLIIFYWNHCIAISCVFKLGGVYMSISHRVKWNATTSILNIMTSNCRSEFHFCLRDRHFFTLIFLSVTSVIFLPPPPHYSNPLPILLIFGKIPSPQIIPNSPIIRHSKLCKYMSPRNIEHILTLFFHFNL